MVYVRSFAVFDATFVRVSAAIDESCASTMGLDISDFPCASPELVWSCVQKSSKYIKGRITSVGGDRHVQASSELGNLRGLHVAGHTGLRHVVAFDLALGDEEGIIKVIEIEPHSHRPNSAKIEHIVPFTSAKTCYQDILKVTHEKRPDLDRALAMKLKGLLSVKKETEEEE